MAKREDTTNNVLRLADFRPIMDPVIKAQRGIDAAGENDAASECARDRFAEAQPKTLAGVHAKLVAIGATLTEVREGDTLTELGWDELFGHLEAAAAFTSRATTRRAG